MAGPSWPVEGGAAVVVDVDKLDARELSLTRNPDAQTPCSAPGPPRCVLGGIQHPTAESVPS